MTVHFVGAGPGAADLITVRAQRLLAECAVCLYAGSLVPAEVLAHCPPAARLIDTADLTLDEIVAAMALNTAGSPEQSRTTSRSAASASTMAATISSRVRSAVSISRAPAGQCARTSAGTRLPAYRQTAHSASRRCARTVIRSAAPGPAPTK